MKHKNRAKKKNENGNECYSLGWQLGLFESFWSGSDNDEGDAVWYEIVADFRDLVTDGASIF